MDDTQLDDLKQFITATVSQATTDMATKQDIAELKTELKTSIHDLETKVDTIADALTENLQDHEQRITKLEHKVA